VLYDIWDAREKIWVSPPESRPKLFPLRVGDVITTHFGLTLAQRDFIPGRGGNLFS
jgi:hypothetical protein